jgi:hypothetical protein
LNPHAWARLSLLHELMIARPALGDTYAWQVGQARSVLPTDFPAILHH